MTKQEPRIFLCHASEDKERVKALYHQLKEAGYHPWLDKYDLLVGQDWWTEIEKIISDPYNLVLVCLSNNSTTKRGVVQREITRALDVLEEMPEDTIYLMPARLEPCDVPRRLSRLHWVDLFEPDGFENLGRALDLELAKHAAPVEPELIHIPAGEFLMGSDPGKDKDARDDEQPQHKLHLPEYYIAKTTVTNAQYRAFVQATGQREPKHWEGENPPAGKENHPVVYVTWHDATAYCQWLAEANGEPYRLPSEAEWEKAARGGLFLDGDSTARVPNPYPTRLYPWGDQWDDQRLPSKEGGTTEVGAYLEGASPYGLLDMAGNVWEWTLSLWGKDRSKTDFKYPYTSGDGRENIEAGDDFARVARGGSWIDKGLYARCAFRGRYFPHTNEWDWGFRLVVAPDPASYL